MLMTLKHQNLAVDLARHSIALHASAIDQMAMNWKVACASNDIMAALAGRMGVFERMAAALVLADPVAYGAARTSALGFGVELASRFLPQPEVLLTELALAIVSADRPARRSLAKAISDVQLDDETLYLDRSQALILAALIDLDYDTVQRLCSELRAACTAREFDKSTTELAERWAHAASKLAGKDLEGCFEDLQALHQSHLKHLDHELARLKRGASSDLSTYDLVDWPCAALARLLGEFGYKPLQLSEDVILASYGVWAQADQHAVDM